MILTGQCQWLEPSVAMCGLISAIFFPQRLCERRGQTRPSNLLLWYQDCLKWCHNVPFWPRVQALHVRSMSRKEVKTGPTEISTEKCRHLVDPKDQNSSKVIIICMTKWGPILYRWCYSWANQGKISVGGSSSQLPTPQSCCFSCHNPIIMPKEIATKRLRWMAESKRQIWIAEIFWFFALPANMAAHGSGWLWGWVAAFTLCPLCNWQPQARTKSNSPEGGGCLAEDFFCFFLFCRSPLTRLT